MPQSKLLAYLRLLRLPNVFTAMADASMGFLFAQGPSGRAETFLCLLAASTLLYLAGMVLNDVFDLEVDRQERPKRPLPSGQIPLKQAQTLGWAMLGLGLVAGIAAGWIGPENSLVSRSGMTALALAACIVLYDGFAKATPAGPIIMGSCRLLNILLGMSAAPILVDRAATLHFTDSQLAVAAGIGVYIAGVTWLSRSEASVSNHNLLAFALTVMVAGLVLVAVFPLLGEQPPLQLRGSWIGGDRPVVIWWAMLALMAAPVIRRVLAAIKEPSSAQVQAAVKHSILSLIFYDAAIIFALHGPLWGGLILVLLIPALLLGRWVYST